MLLRKPSHVFAANSKLKLNVVNEWKAGVPSDTGVLVTGIFHRQCVVCIVHLSMSAKTAKIWCRMK